jgi:hypothetical protein
MIDFLTRSWEQLAGRTGGPLHLRFLIQPVVAGVLATLAGLRDVRQGHPPYLWTVVSDAAERRRLIQSGWKDVGKLFVVAFTLDAAYQILVFRWFYPAQTLIVAIALALVPYVLIRGPVTRLLRRRKSIATDAAKEATVGPVA